VVTETKESLIRAIAVLVVVIVALGVAAARATAEPPELLTELSPNGSTTGSAASEFSDVRGIAVDQTTGHFYVADAGNRRIDEFTPWGVFVRAWGWGVKNGAAELQTCTTLTGCQAGSGGSGSGQFSIPTGVAVDSAGDVYVLDLANHRIEKFDSEGNFLLSWGGDVVASGPDNSTKDEEQEVVIAASSGTFKLGFEDPLGGNSTATTAPLPYNASAAEVEAALGGLPTIESHGGSVSVAGGPGDPNGSSPYLITFDGSLSGDDVPQLKLDRSALGPSEPGTRLPCATEIEAESIEYRWLRNGEPIAGATSPTYVTGPEDEGKAIQCQVSAINDNAGSTQTANPAYVAPPAPATPPPVAPERIESPQHSGNLSVGEPGGAIFTCAHETWQGALSFTYRWYRNGTELPGAAGETYEVSASDLATPADFQCEVIGHNAGGATARVSQLNSGTSYTGPEPLPHPPFGYSGEQARLEGVRTAAAGGAAEICRPGAGDTCKAGVAGRSPGEFREQVIGDLLTAGPLIAAGPESTIYVGGPEQIQGFEPGGSAKLDLSLPSRLVHALAAAPSGDLYASYTVPGQGLNQAISEAARLHLLSTSGSESWALELSNETSFVFPNVLAADSGGNLYAAVDESAWNTGQGVNQVLEFDSDGNSLIPLGTGFPIPAGKGDVTADFRGLATNPVGDLLVEWEEPSSGPNPEGTYLNVYGPSPISIEPPPAVEPQITGQYAATVTSTSAELQARINPKFWPDASYRVQYGATPCQGGGCAETPAVALTSKSVNSALPTAPVQLSDLEEGTTYHYRFVTDSSGGGPSYGPDRTFRTYRQAPAALPDSRAYELVSPGAKDGAEVGLPGRGAGGGAEFSVQPEQASPSGSAVTYSSFTAFGDAQSAPAASQYLSTRGPAGWQTQNINPLFEEGYTRDPLVGFSSDLSHGAVIAIEPPLSAASYKSLPNLYLRDNAQGTLTSITTEPPTPQVTGKVSNFCLMYEGSSANSNHIVFAAYGGALLKGDPTGQGFNLYEWSPEGGVQLLSLLPNGAPAVPAALTTVGNPGGSAGGGGVAKCLATYVLMRRGVSASGSRAFWHYEGSYEGAKEPLFARVGGSETVRLDAPNVGTSGSGGQGTYWDASTDGSRVFFTAPKRLTQQPTLAAQGAPDENLYSYDFDLPEGERLTNLAPKTGEGPHVQGVIGASEGGDFVYFVATGALAVGAQAGKPNLYVWHDGEELKYIATLESADSSDWSDETQRLTAEVPADGRHLAFLSTASLTGFNNRLEGNGAPISEVYLYDFDSGQISCASCNAAGTAPTGSAAVPTWSTPYQAPHVLSDDGRRLFFTTPDALDPVDRNGHVDVYEFERSGTGSCSPNDPAFNPDSAGCDYLISSGSSSAESYFIDASSDGSDVFFSTRDRLDPFRDHDERYDIYDASVDGTAPSPLPSECRGSCPEGGSSAPTPVLPATSGSLHTEPLPKTLHCRKGTRKDRRHGKTVCVKVGRNRKHPTKGKSGR
jgi:hypothetical protein